MALSRHRSLLVIARNSTFALKGHGGNVRRIGRDLGAGYVVQGSVRRTGPRVRITAQLVETQGGQHIWAEQYDRELQEIFELQDEIASTVAARIEPEIGNAERMLADRKSPQAFDAWDFFHLATKHFYKSTAGDNREAQRLFRRAINPSFTCKVQRRLFYVKNQTRSLSILRAFAKLVCLIPRTSSIRRRECIQLRTNTEGA